VLGGASLALTGSGIKKVKPLDIKPEQTIESAKEAARALKGTA
jgi:uncharacterized metal-binding protein